MIRTLYTLDDQVDKLMLALQARGELDNTLIIFTSDNSYMWGEHQACRASFCRTRKRSTCRW